jgi:ABC-type cobalamin transport system permease subunit
LVSAAALLFQVSQTRLFSASYGYHLTYLVISVSLLGVGSGATLSALFDRRPRRPGLVTLALAAAASALAALLLETHIDPGTALAAAILVAYVAGALPFVFASWIVVRSLREDPVRAGRL